MHIVHILLMYIYIYSHREDFFLAITDLLDSDDSDQENVPSPPSASPLRDLSGANSPGPDAPQPVPPPVPVPPLVQPVPVPPLAAQAQQLIF